MSRAATPADVLEGRARPTPETLRRFWSKVDREHCSGCWLWTGAVNANGYANFALRHGSTLPAHRFAYAVEIGLIPNGLIVRHKCDVRVCVNPAHLVVGTQADNIADMFERNRAPVGERHYSRTKPWIVRAGTRHHAAKLTDANVAEIRAQRAAGVSGRRLAQEFGVSPQQVSKIVRGQRWSRRGNS